MNRVWLPLFLAASLHAQTARFPSAIATDRDLSFQKDRSQSTLTGAMTASATSFTVVTGSKFAEGIIATIDNEQVLVCSVVGNTVNVGYASCPNIDGRGWAGTAAASHSNGSLVSANVVAWSHNAVKEEVKAIETALGANLANVASLIPNPTPVDKGGTNASTAAGARSNLGAAASGANNDITSLSALSTPLSASQGGTGTASVTGVIIGSGTSPYAGVTGTALQQLRVKPNQSGTVYEFASPVDLYAPDYNWIQSPGGSLSAGSNTITLTPCPLGIAGTATTTYLYVSGGVGTAEAGLITGGTCTAGASTGTIIVTMANSHSGAWAIGSQAGGIPEALNSLSSGNGTVKLNRSATIQAHAKITFPSGRSSFDGGNFFGYAIARASDYPNGDLLYFPAGANVAVRNMWINNATAAAQTSGAALAYAPGSDADVTNVYVVGGYIGYDFNGTATIDWNASSFSSGSQNQYAGVWIRDTSGSHNPVNSIFTGGHFSLNSNTWGMLIQAADGFQANNLAFGGGKIGVYLSLGNVAGNYLTSVKFTNLYVDNSSQSGVKIDGPAGIMSNIHFVGGSIHADANPTSFYGFDVCFSNACTSGLADWSIVGMNVLGHYYSGIAVGTTATGGVISGNNIHANNYVNSPTEGGIKLDTGAGDLAISGNRVSNNGGVFTGQQKCGVCFLGAADNVSVVGNNLAGNTAALAIGGTLTNSAIGPNGGADGQLKPVASAATITLGPEPFWVITGTTAVATINGGWTGRRVRLAFSAGSPGGLLATGNIAYAKTVTQNQQLDCIYDGAKWACVGP